MFGQWELPVKQKIPLTVIVLIATFSPALIVWLCWKVLAAPGDKLGLGIVLGILAIVQARLALAGYRMTGRIWNFYRDR